MTIDDGNCNFHSSSYYCQSLKTTTTTTTTPKVLISKVFNNLNGGSTKHTSSISSGWATHIFPIKTGLPSGTLVTPGTMYYRLGTSSVFNSVCKIGSGMSSGNKDIPMSYGWLCRGIRIWLPPWPQPVGIIWPVALGCLEKSQNKVDRGCPRTDQVDAKLPLNLAQLGSKLQRN